MVLFFIADLALTLAFRLSAWCLGKTYNGIVYLVTHKPQNTTPNGSDGDCNDDCVVITMTMSRQEYDAFKHSHAHELHHGLSEDSSSAESLSLSSSK
jgi:hypothetical protein